MDLDRPGASVTLADIAADTGFSVSSVSRALNGRPHASSESQDRILEAARRLGYDPARQRRGRPLTRGSTIDLVLSQIDNQWSSEVIVGACNAAVAHGFDLVLTPERDDPDDDWPARLRDRRPFGAVLALIHPTKAQLGSLIHSKVPIVLLEPQSETTVELPRVGSTDFQGGWDAAEHLAASGCRRFIVVAGEPRYRFGRARIEGFRAGIRAVLPNAPVDVVSAAWAGDDVVPALAPLLRGGDSLLGIFCENDPIAHGAYAACRDAGLAIPEDVGIIGFDDLPYTPPVVPGLTTIHLPLREMAATAVSTLVALAGGRAVDQLTEIPMHLVQRESTLARRSS